MEATDGILNSDREFQELLREIPQKPRDSETPSETPYCLDFCVRFRGKCCPFLSGIFSWRPSLLFLRFFQSSICLRFFLGELFATSSELGVRRFWVSFGLEMPLFFVQKTAKKSSPFLRLVFFRSSNFVTACFSGGFWATNSVLC